MLPYEKSPNHYQTGEQRKVDLPILKKDNLLNNQIMAQKKLIHQIMYFRIGIMFSTLRPSRLIIR